MPAFGSLGREEMFNRHRWRWQPLELDLFLVTLEVDATGSKGKQHRAQS